MLARAEIRNCEEEARINTINAVIQEMRSEAANFGAELHGNRSNSSLIITFEKKLESGRSPDRIDVEVALNLGGEKRPFIVNTYKAAVTSLKTKAQEAIAPRVIEDLMTDMEEINKASSESEKIDMMEVQGLLISPTAVWRLRGENGMEEKRIDGRTIPVAVDDPKNTFY